MGINTRHNLSIIVTEREFTGKNASIGTYIPFNSDAFLMAVDYAYEHGFPLDFYVNTNAVTKDEFIKAIAENVEFDQRVMDQREQEKQYQELLDDRHF